MKKRDLILCLVLLILFFLFQRLQYSASYARNLEKEIVIEGKLEVHHFDNFDAETSKDVYYLVTSNNERFLLDFVTKPPKVLTGTQIKVKGKIRNNQITVSSYSISSSLPAIATVKKVGVILFNFQNYMTQPLTPTQAKGIVFTNSNSVKSYYLENSFGQLILEGKYDANGDVFGWYTIPYDNVGCQYLTWFQAANAAANAAGVDLTGYNNLIYAFPSMGGCTFGGGGFLGGQISFVTNAALNFNVFIVGHELGHNFGAHHANSYLCTDSAGLPVPISNSCTSWEYGDPFDIMGGSIRHMNNFHKGQLSTFNALQPINTLTVTANGIYTIAPIEQASAGVQAIRIPRGSSYYYLEYRQPYGYDNFPSSAPVVNGVSIRIAPPYPVITQSNLIDTIPSTTTRDDAPLLPGPTFYDPIYGITIRTLSVSPTSATVDIAFGGLTCTHSNPILSINPASQTGYAGQTLNYALTITNTDTPICPASTFSISYNLPPVLSQSTSSSLVTINAGSSSTQTISITSAASAAFGSYSFSETVTNIGLPSYGASAAAYYDIGPVVAPQEIPDTTPPTITILNPLNNTILPNSGNVQISATATDSSGINNIKIYVDGVLKKTCNNTTTCNYNLNMNTITSGQHIITVTATDNSSAQNTGSVSITVIKL
mgnify:FL=1